MPILESIRNKLQVLGMSTQHSIQKYPFNARNLASLFIHGMNITCSIGFMFAGTENKMEMIVSLFIIITAISDISIFIHLNWNMQRLFEFINKLDNTVDQSKRTTHRHLILSII